MRDQGYIERTCATDYDVALALDTELLFRFLKATQPQAWQTLVDHYSGAAETEVLKRLAKALNEQSTHKVLRDGIKLVPNKSNTIAWTAHQIINLHDDQDLPIFDTAIIVTDRLVLDRQLQETISGFAQTGGVVKKIDGTSRDLKEAIQKGARISRC